MLKVRDTELRPESALLLPDHAVHTCYLQKDRQKDNTEVIKTKDVTTKMMDA